MIKKLALETITGNCPPNVISFAEIIAERKILKTRLKLLHIAAFDRDLIKINSDKKDLKSLSLDNFYLTPENSLVVPVSIVEANQNPKSKTLLRSYLIYLSYLYNIDFLNLFYNHPTIFYKTIFSLNISEDIKQSLFFIIRDREGSYFSKFIDDLNTHTYRESLEEDKKRLMRELK